jgi:quinol monooxygenase YgiN
MRDGEQIRFVLDFAVDDVERFKQVARACVEVSRDEPGTLVYDWYVDEEAGRARLYEAYADADAVRAHASGPVFTSVGLPLMEISTVVNMDAYGDVSALGDFDLWPTTRWGPPFVALKEQSPQP